MTGVIQLRRAAAVALAMLAIAPTSALAGTLSSSGSVVTYSGGSEANDVLITQSGNTITVTDNTSAIDAANGCSLEDGDNEFRASCTLTSLSEVRVYVGGGNDRVWASNVQEVMDVAGGPGLDTITAGELNDTIDGGDDRDIVNGHEGNDEIWGGYGNDSLHGSGGSDSVNGGPGLDNVQGHEGNDALHGGDGDDDLLAGSGKDQLNGYFGNDELEGQADEDVLFGSFGDDVLHGGTQDDVLQGNAGNDKLSGQAGVDTYEGGTQADQIYSVDDTDESVDCGGGWDAATLNLGDSILYDSCENFTFQPKLP
jgi:Ca2+-binding RTX toxin-like protein